MKNLFKRGYTKYLYDKLVKGAFYTASCTFCKYEQDGTCINNEVTPFDMVENNEKSSCTFFSFPDPLSRGE